VRSAAKANGIFVVSDDRRSRELRPHLLRIRRARIPSYAQTAQLLPGLENPLLREKLRAELEIWCAEPASFLRSSVIVKSAKIRSTFPDFKNAIRLAGLVGCTSS
jgi:hypothetical protein